MTAHRTHRSTLANGTVVLRCSCGWESRPSTHEDALGWMCEAAYEHELRRDFAVVNWTKDSGARIERTYRLSPNGTATRISAVGIAGTPAVYYASDEEPLRLVLEDGRGYLVTLDTCDHCGEQCELPVEDGSGHRFCDGDCRREYQEAY